MEKSDVVLLEGLVIVQTGLAVLGGWLMFHHESIIFTAGWVVLASNVAMIILNIRGIRSITRYSRGFHRKFDP